jgi:hypothetical protein
VHGSFESETLALAFIGGLGTFLYLAALLFVPSEGGGGLQLSNRHELSRWAVASAGWTDTPSVPIPGM